MPKVGIIGGTFDPIHNAHICMAKAALEMAGLSEVIFVPGGNPPHKRGMVSDKNIRLAMTMAAVEKEQRMSVSEYEVKKEGYSYTSDTLRYMTEKHPENRYCFIMGADSLDYIEDWHEPEVIMALAELVVFSRNDFDAKKKAEELMAKFGGRVTFVDKNIPNISSTEIRMRAELGLSLEKYLPRAAEDIIKSRELYRGELFGLRETIEKKLTPKRFLHTMGVCETAARLAKLYGESLEKTYKAALLHDCAKNIPEEEMYRMCREYGVELDETEKKCPQLVHAKLGAYMAEHMYGIEDSDVINAIKWHTLGRSEMSLLEKIIFVADMAEDGRSFDGVEEIRKTAEENLDRAVYMCADLTIRFNEEKGNKVHENAYIVREFYKKISILPKNIWTKAEKYSKIEGVGKYEGE